MVHGRDDHGPGFQRRVEPCDDTIRVDESESRFGYQYAWPGLRFDPDRRIWDPATLIRSGSALVRRPLQNPS